MGRLVLHWVCVLALTALPIGGCSDETTAAGGSGGSGDTGGDGGAAGSGGDGGETWFAFGKDYAHTRANINETVIVPATVADLTVKWTWEAPGMTATPLVVDGVAYWADWGGSVRAADAVTGEEVWTNSSYGGDLPGVSSTPFLSDGYLYVALRKGDVVKLDIEDGSEEWNTPVRASKHVHLYGSPSVADGILVLGVSGNGTSSDGQPIPEDILDDFFGNVHGIDIESGEILWVFETTKGPDGTQYGAGVSVWSSATLDTTRKLAYVGTGNGYYQPVSPYSDALLAIDYMTGELVWHVQFTEDDDYTSATGGIDADVGATPNLFIIGSREVVGVGDKAGWYHVHDRDTGQRIWSTNFTTPEGKTIFGSTLGGIMAPAAYHDGVLYIAINHGDLFTVSSMLAVNAGDGSILWQKSHNGSRNFGAPTYAGGIIYTGDAGFLVETSTLLAYDADTGDLLWSEPMPDGRGGGLTIVNGMLYVGQGFHLNRPGSAPLPGSMTAYGL
ncbi:MAG: PQQ-binding-like beta-propeller repeat protein [Deltaproteobacteria bacterium]|nr:PQQ-binding-like beta-propeller repeat protein [Deltaproteobacteria bacterium]MBW1904935.1 PQQ-binding-like beta-propeller repeat protein [Deltaproteobacteria bacterium]MBW2159589.1 PQQ-binding-like beta-propeller repeat protein [Deltaproteobacteria bacterium]MBW2213854.1 PQQ-binding-like beta-propeller repeat protein [Deltaproteobacteria bacterium]MBW2379560.1 PQQ-binding-like beta-propeller repeat protein [Deltaproteobacteria bacterium]